MKADGEAEVGIKATNDIAYTRWSCHSGLTNSVQIVSTHPALSNGGPITIFWQAKLFETNPGPTNTRKQV